MSLKGGRDLAQREEGHVNMEAETGVMLPQAKGHLQPPEAGRKPGTEASLGPRGERGPEDTLV